MSFHKTAAAGKSVTTSEKNKFKLQQASSAIAGTADGLKRQLAKLEQGGGASLCAAFNAQQHGGLDVDAV
jgi:hypothetical protein